MIFQLSLECKSPSRLSDWDSRLPWSSFGSFRDPQGLGLEENEAWRGSGLLWVDTHQLEGGNSAGVRPLPPRVLGARRPPSLSCPVCTSGAKQPAYCAGTERKEGRAEGREETVSEAPSVSQVPGSSLSSTSPCSLTPVLGGGQWSLHGAEGGLLGLCVRPGVRRPEGQGLPINPGHLMAEPCTHSGSFFFSMFIFFGGTERDRA